MQGRISGRQLARLFLAVSFLSAAFLPGCTTHRTIRLSDEALPPPPYPEAPSDETLIRGQDPEYGFQSLDAPDPGLLEWPARQAPDRPGAATLPSPPADSATVPPPPSGPPLAAGPTGPNYSSEEPPWHHWLGGLLRPAVSACGPVISYDGRCAPGTFPIEYVPFANTWAFAYYDGFELPANDFRNAGRFGINWASPLVSDYVGLGVQAGASGSVTEDQEQIFVTAGVFYRGDMQLGAAWNVGAVADFLHDGFYDVQVVQVRGKVSYTVDFRNELGVWGSGGVSDDDINAATRAETANQVNIFWRHLWNVGLDSELWVGWRDGQSDADESNSQSGAAIGARLVYPVTDAWTVAVGGHSAFESDTWNVWAGVQWNLGGRARQRFLGQNRHAPLFPVADNSTMTLAIEPK